MNLTWHSSFASLTGYSGSSLAFALGLDRRGHAVRPLYLYGADRDERVAMGGINPRIAELQRTPLRLDAPQVVYAPGDRFAKNSGAIKIGFTMLEGDRLPPSWVEQANQMDEIWTPSAWGAEVFADSGVLRPIVVVPLGVDAARYAPLPPRAQLGETTVFLSVFEWGARKGWDILLRAYRRAFGRRDPVLLLLKVDCREPGVNAPQQIAAALGEGPRVGLIYNQPLDGARMRELYAGADCFVLPTRGEGWGMPILEAMACGTPAIATDWSGQTMFLDTRNGYPLPIRGLVAADPTHDYLGGARWAEPDEDALVELLRRAHRRPEERRALGIAAAASAGGWSWERGLNAIEARLTFFTNYKEPEA